MQRVAWALVVLALVSVLAGCGVADSPETAAREWFLALANLDGNELAERTCTAQQEMMQEAGLWFSVFSIFGQETLGEQCKIDASNLRFTTVERSGDSAYVQVRGRVRVAILALSQAQDVDETWRMVREEGKWKWCGE